MPYATRRTQALPPADAPCNADDVNVDVGADKQHGKAPAPAALCTCTPDVDAATDAAEAVLQLPSVEQGSLAHTYGGLVSPKDMMSAVSAWCYFAQLFPTIVNVSKVALPTWMQHVLEPAAGTAAQEVFAEMVGMTLAILGEETVLEDADDDKAKVDTCPSTSPTHAHGSTAHATLSTNSVGVMLLCCR